MTAGGPLVSCVLPTQDRRPFLPSAITGFLAQDYEPRELLVLDDGADPVADLIPDDPRVRYVRLPGRAVLGKKRNMACEMARGELVAHWDDDDWYAPHRLSRQVAFLQGSGAELVGLERPLYLDLREGRAYEYRRPAGVRQWLTMLCYRRALWARSPFPEIPVGSDTRFLWRLPVDRLRAMPDGDLNLCSIHGRNVSPKRLESAEWRPLSQEALWARFGDDGARRWAEGLARDLGARWVPRVVPAPSPARAPRRPRPADSTVLVTTGDRPERLRELLGDLEREVRAGHRLDLRVFDDGTAALPEALRCRILELGGRHQRAAAPHGRRLYWRCLDELLRDLAAHPSAPMLAFLPDDVRLEEGFFAEARALFEGIRDPAKLTLAVAGGPVEPRWTGFAPERDGPVWRTQWVDLPFIAPAALASVLGHRMPPVPGRWFAREGASSGVGRTLSVRLAGAGHGLYLAEVPLAHHVPGPSRLHPERTAPPPAEVSRAPAETSRAPAEASRAPAEMSRAVRPWVVVVTTFERPKQLLGLLEDLVAERERGVELDVRVYDDASRSVDPAISALLAREGWRLRRAGARHGKRRYWRWVGEAYGALRDAPSGALFAFLQDDVRLCRGFFRRAEALWSGIDDPAKATLTVLVDGAREHAPVWTGVLPQRLGDVWRTGWVDQLFVADRSFLEALEFRVPEVPPSRWARDPTASSGVGWAISHRLLAAGRTMYRSHESLLAHVRGASLMNPEVRARQPLETVRFADGAEALARLERPFPVHAALATIPGRLVSLERVVAALEPQVDQLCVYLNGHLELPRFLTSGKIEVATSREHGDRGDAGKMFWCARAEVYQLTCDDDLLYPPDYVARLIDGIERHGRRAAVGLHGVRLSREVRSYYRDRSVLHFTAALARDTPVHILGTGCAGWFASTLTASPGDFPAPDMADVWLGRLAQLQEVPMIALAHPAGWLQSLGTEPGIFERTRGNDRRPTEVVRSLAPWRLWPAPERREAALSEKLAQRPGYSVTVT